MGAGQSVTVTTPRTAPQRHGTALIERLENDSSARCKFVIESIRAAAADNSRISIRNYCSTHGTPADIARIVYSDSEEYVVDKHIQRCIAKTEPSSRVVLDFGTMRGSNIDYLNTGNAVTDCIVNDDLTTPVVDVETPEVKYGQLPVVALLAILGVVVLCSTLANDIHSLELLFYNNEGDPVSNLVRMPPPTRLF